MKKLTFKINITWEKVVSVLEVFAVKYVKKYAVAAALKALSLSGGLWTWIVGLFISKGIKEGIEELEHVARLEDMENQDEKNMQKKKDDIAKGEPVETIIKDELAILNRKPTE